MGISKARRTLTAAVAVAALGLGASVGAGAVQAKSLPGPDDAAVVINPLGPTRQAAESAVDWSVANDADLTVPSVVAPPTNQPAIATELPSDVVQLAGRIVNL